MASRLAIYHPPGQLGLGPNPFGKDVANLQLYQALARHGGLTHLDLFTQRAAAPEDVAQALLDGAPGPAIGVHSILDQGAVARAGALLRGQPDLAELAWMRRRAVGDRGHSLVGLVHTLAPPAMRETIAASILAPTQAWDAVLCTSPAVKAVLTDMFDRLGAHMAARFGARRQPRPQLPVIPLGVDGGRLQALADRPDVRADLRGRLGVGEDEILVIWVGRLSFFEKAFPQPMFRAVEEAATLSGKRAHFALAGWFPNGDLDRGRYEQAARAYAPSIRTHFLDGNDAGQVGGLWAAGDIFLSLVDNIQETFGITPVEAMAAGLPVVASDWDGYRFTVRDGVEGFLIPTLGAPSGPVGEAIAARHGAQIESYQAYVGAVAQHTAVNVGRAARALADLMASAELRARMGAAGRARVRDALDWRVVAAQVTALVDDLAQIRAAAPDPGRTPRLNPVKGDPFDDFRGFATEVLGLDQTLGLRPGAGAADLERADAVELDRAFSGWRATSAEAQAIVARLSGGAPLTVREILAGFPTERRRAVLQSLMWLAKLGVIDWLEAG